MSGLNGPLVQRPEDAQTLTSTLRFVKRAIEMDMECMLPCRVVSYDRVRNVAEVRPQIVVTKRDPAGGPLQRTPRVNIPDIPVLSLGAGGFHISFPINAGDLGWIWAADRDITLFLQNLQETHAATDGASHKFSDAVFIPDAFRTYTINAEDADALVIQSTDSATRISIRADNIKITTPVTVLLDTPLVETTHNLKVGGDINVVGSATVSGPNCALPQATTVATKPIWGHNHNGQVPGFPA